MRTALVTDSPAYLPEDLRADLDIQVVPLHVRLGPRECREGVDVSADEVAEALRAGVPVSTSRPTPRAYEEAYAAAAAAGAGAVVSVHISAELSSTIGSAHLAARSASLPVTVIDSRSIGMALGYAVLAGARAARRGASHAEVADIVRARSRASSLYFYVDTLEHLRRGGRIGGASALVGTALAIKPILRLEAGRIVPSEKVRTSLRALARLEEVSLARIAEQSGVGSVDLAVHHLGSPERAQRIADHLAEQRGVAGDLRVVELGAVVGAHVGPGTIAVAISPCGGQELP